MGTSAASKAILLMLKVYFGTLIKYTKDAGARGVVLDEKYAKEIQTLFSLLEFELFL